MRADKKADLAELAMVVETIEVQQQARPGFNNEAMMRIVDAELGLLEEETYRATRQESGEDLDYRRWDT